jgi:dTMP kinase
MFKKKALFITFEGIEGSGKTYQSTRLFNKIKNLGLNSIYSREPGGSSGSEMIRRIILNGKKNKFTKTTDTLLYLAARNEHIEKKIIPAMKKKKIIICDRFIDSTYAYQVYANKVDKRLVDLNHKIILRKIKPDLTFILNLTIEKAFLRVKKRKKLNRYDKFPKKFYQKAQKGFLEIAKLNKKRCVIVDNSIDSPITEELILKKFLTLLKK